MRSRPLILRKTPWKGTSLSVPVRATGGHCAGGPSGAKLGTALPPQTLVWRRPRSRHWSARGEAGREAKIAYVRDSCGPALSFQKASHRVRTLPAEGNLPWGEGSGKKNLWDLPKTVGFPAASPKHLAQRECSSWRSPVSAACGPHLCRGPLAGYVFVDFSSEEEVRKALKCNREYMGKDARTVAGALAVSYSIRSR